MKWLLLAPLLVASAAAAQPQLPARQRQDRRAALPTTPAEPMLELYVAANNLTTVAFNSPLDRDSLVVDRTRFKWAQVSDSFLLLQPFADLAPDDKLIVQVGFKDHALPAKAVLTVTSKADVMDGSVEVDRRANTPVALLAALKQKDSDLEELKARCEGSGPAGIVLSGWLNEQTYPVGLSRADAYTDTSGLEVRAVFGYDGKFSALVAFRLRNLPGQLPWVLGQTRITSPGGVPVKVISAQMRPEHLVPGEEGLVVVEVKEPPWTAGKAFNVELEDGSGQRRLSFTLINSI
ncbi:MAG: DUF2381 family protein [Hyalangium sp.]|uniref:DUF2381 family protein n=1 Tax=Hyalangium sp. TaxID=2028555 RepID=UPI00389A73FE